MSQAYYRDKHFFTNKWIVIGHCWRMLLSDAKQMLFVFKIILATIITKIVKISNLVEIIQYDLSGKFEVDLLTGFSNFRLTCVKVPQFESYS